MDGSADIKTVKHPKIEIGHAELIAAEREYCNRSLANFIRRAWHVIEPAQEYVHGWHIDALGEHLQAVHDGEISRLAIAIPPGSMKSLTSSVLFPAWEWGPKGKPSIRTIATSHSENLAIRDNLRAKRLVDSDWYKALWPEVELSRDQQSKSNFENTATGFRQASPFTSLTGKRGDRVIIDDPLSVDGANSDQIREKVMETFTEAVPTRLNSPKHSAIVVIAQRLHENDVIGYIENNDLGYEQLVLPMEFDPQRKCTTSIGWQDPRTEENELMFPERFPREVVERDKKILGTYAVSSQFQQLPVPRSGGLFQPDRVKVIESLPFGQELVYCRAWDLAGTEGAGAYTAGVLLAYAPEQKRFIICDAKRERLGPSGVRKLIQTTADYDGYETQVVIPQDPGQAGKAQSEDLVADLAGFRVKVERQTGSKQLRAEPLAAQIEAGNVDIVYGPWNDALLNEMRFFPRGQYKDQVDATSSAFNFLAHKIRRKSAPMYIGGGKQDNWASIN